MCSTGRDRRLGKTGAALSPRRRVVRHSWSMWSVPGDPQQVQRHVVRHARGNGLQHALGIGKVTAVLPQEMRDERFRPIPASARAHERVLQFTGDPAHVKHPVSALHPLQVDSRHVQTIAEQEVGWRRIAMQPDLPVLPHLRPITPAVTQLA